MEIMGTTQEVLLGGLTVKVKVLDYKQSYGKDRWLITPVEGSGEVWVEKEFTSKGKKK